MRFRDSVRALALASCFAAPALAAASQSAAVAATSQTPREQVLAAFEAGADARTLRPLLAPLQAAAKAARQGSAEQVDLDATLARLYIGLRDERRANEAAQRAWRFAPGHWKDNPEASGHAYLAMSQFFLARGYFPDAWRVSEEGLRLWTDALATTAADPAATEQDRFRKGSRYIDLVSTSALAALTAQCSGDYRMWVDLGKVGETMRGRPSWDTTYGPRQLSAPDLRYPSDMLDVATCGYAIMRFEVNEQGIPTNIETLANRPHPAFSEAARRHIAGKRYQAGMPTKGLIITYNFVLKP